MENKDWVVEWLKKLRNDVEHLTKMIYAARSEIESPVIKKVREALEAELKQVTPNDVVDPESVMTWLQRVREKLELAGVALQSAAGLVEKKDSETKKAATRALRLAGRILSTHRIINEALSAERSYTQTQNKGR